MTMTSGLPTLKVAKAKELGVRRKLCVHGGTCHHMKLPNDFSFRTNVAVTFWLTDVWHISLYT